VTGIARLRGWIQRPDVAIVHEFRPPPYGGSNQFLTALRDELRRRGLRVSGGATSARTRACLLHSYLVDTARLSIPEGARVVHRVDGPITLYRGVDDGADRRIVEINDAFADATVFQSEWSLAAHRKLGIRLRDSVVIHNAVDPKLFFPASPRPLGSPVRLISTSWSDNPRKGGATLRLLAERLDSARFTLTFVGRTSVELPGARVIPPVPSAELADLLRGHDVYVAPSLDDPCSNALLEALSCGLPALYALSGGHPELVGEAGLGFDDPGELPDALDRLVGGYEERRSRISTPSLADVADRYLAVLGLA
jgi:glycosyltransferase involved in cell wall biosynthesis